MAKKETYTPKNEHDDENPDFIFALTSTALLVGIATREIDVVRRARQALANRGMGPSGTWVGFDKAKKIWKV